MSEYDVYRRQILMYKDSPCSERVNSFKSKKNVKKIIGLRGNFVNVHTKINLFRSVGKYQTYILLCHSVTSQP